jgi:hypothetical protein
MRLSPGRAAGLAFLTAAVTLLLQILVHRMVSAKLLNNYAFLVISLTMLGFALSGVVLSFRCAASWSGSRTPPTCARLCSSSACSSRASPSTQRGAGSFRRLAPGVRRHLFGWMPYALLFALPFAFSGLILGALLAAPDLPARRIYFWDLVGSAVGAFAAIPAIQLLGVEWSSLALCAAFLLGTLLLAPPPSRRVRVVLGATAAGLLACFLLKDRALDVYYPEGSMLAPATRLGRRPRAHGLGPACAHRGGAHPTSRSADDVLSLPDR